jgi:hypothetical protein
MFADSDGSAASSDPNPYLSPHAEPFSGDASPSQVSMNSVLIWCSINAGVALKLGTSFGTYSSPYVPLLVKGGCAVSDLVVGVLVGIGWAALACVLLRRRFRSLMPGHWLAIEASSILLGDVVSIPWYGQPGFTVGISSFFMQQLVSDSVRNLVGAGLFVAVGCLTSESRRWRAYAWLSAGVYLLSLLDIPLSLGAAEAHGRPFYLAVEMVRFSTGLSVWASRVVFVVAIIKDFKLSVARDGLHWIGIGLTILAAMIAAMTNILGAFAA